MTFFDCSYVLKVSPERRVLTEAAADVDVEVDRVVAVFHQVAGGQVDQRCQVVLPAIAVKHIAWYLQPRGMHFQWQS